MKVALVHDYLNEYGGAEKVLEALSKIWPEAPIYTAFTVPGSSATKAFEGRKVITSWFGLLPFYERLYSPLRFLIPWIWGSLDFSGYDLIITSASWYVTKGLGKRFGVKEICYCHTPPRWLYGYETSINWQRYWPVRVYALIVGHFLRMHDFEQAQKVDIFVANSKNVASRIRKFYRRECVVIYPPVECKSVRAGGYKRKDYYLIVSRIVGGKGLELAIEAAGKYGFELKIAGERAGYSNKFLISNYSNYSNIEFLGRVSEEEKYRLMAGAKAFLALAKNEDFGITPVEAMTCGTPVIAFDGGGYRETVVNKKTGLLFDDYSVEGLGKAMKDFNKLKWNETEIKKWAGRFSEERFKKEMLQLVERSME
ncbi:hypothetical protein A3D85_02975 [Candidatus Amesbacteria bacterium RIFCSPHIGHO2_02_FULL_47_9]|uniref:Glycosyl transferase family 1 domain-containing protein n=1 Tax=Candidatus Amesbacteria bacterium RIFCSPHIGHO2_01_FULL_48_32b TaxID=1797253 RepID=A0A1F4YFD3_9BACT|nr:MAG: hypothetical protein A2876_04190 [Candidatus Amesbacteria bacterium RIFCSPHIGHO2_01_FULL_48_32b]OGD05057.1 MAG: hypothetical protein A3D85_02975 [Candidatus Amesbacteria bacterium RIFCSPHIGHO2_02_FULL_47_9]OGD08599.1 MAG: hypothetical protein A2899_02460 [Candidatus Amesbacteria bacterium RIFCSPLOWO2_01_FULL_49_25]